MSVTAQYTSPTHSLNVTHALNPSDGSQKSSLEALRQAILSTQADLNVYLTERKLEEDRASGVNGTATKRKKRNEDEEEDAEDGDEDAVEEDE
jgi:Gon7 family